MTIIPQESVEAKPHGPDLIKVQCMDVYTFRTIQKELTKENTEFHTFSLPENNTFKIVIKDLLKYITETEVLDELNEQGFDVVNVRQFDKEGKIMPIHMITLRSSPENKNIFKMTFLLYTKIQVERYKSNCPAQCYNCQKFGHSSLNCRATPRCVKCSGQHKAKDCPKQRNAPIPTVITRRITNHVQL